MTIIEYGDDKNLPNKEALNNQKCMNLTLTLTLFQNLPALLYKRLILNLDFILNILEITLISGIRENYTLLHKKCSPSHPTPTIFTLNWESPPINFNDWAIEEIFTEHASINSSRHENNANFGISLNDITQHYQKEVSLL